MKKSKMYKLYHFSLVFYVFFIYPNINLPKINTDHMLHAL